MQWARFTPEERTRLAELHTQALQRGPVQSLGQTTAADSLLYAREHLFERVSVAHDYELKTEALRHGRGHMQLTDLKGEIMFEQHSGALLKVGTEVATRESVNREHAMLQIVQKGLGQYPRLGGAQEFVVSDRLRPEQKHAVQAILAINAQPLEKVKLAAV